MSKAFTRARRVVVPMLTALVVLSQTAPAAFAMSADDVTNLAATNQQVEIVQNIPVEAGSGAAVTLSVAGSTYTVLANTGDTMSQFSDWNKEQGGWWFGRESIKYAVDKGYIQGMTDGGKLSIGGNVTVSEAMFATVLMRMVVSQADQQKYIAQDRAEWIADQQLSDQFNGVAIRSESELGTLYDANQTGRNWAAQNMYVAKKAGLLDGVSASTNGAGDCSRATMAKMLFNALRLKGEDVTKADTKAAINAMSDRISIQNSGVAQEIGTAIALGLITGDNNKAFNPTGTMDRASMCEVLHRLDNPSGQRAAAIKQTGLSGESTTNPNNEIGGNTEAPGQNVSGAITIDMRNPGSHRAPQEGDTVIRSDGSSVVLARDPKTGVLGYGQNVGAYLGTLCSNGATVSEDMVGGASTGGWSDGLASGTYIQSPVAGQEDTYHWTQEWRCIQDRTSPNTAGVKGTDGQVDSTGLWQYSDKYGSWVWLGPLDV